MNDCKHCLLLDETNDTTKCRRCNTATTESPWGLVRQQILKSSKPFSMYRFILENAPYGHEYEEPWNPEKLHLNKQVYQYDQELKTELKVRAIIEQSKGDIDYLVQRLTVKN